MDWTEEQLDTIRQAQEKAFPFIENCQITIPKLEKGYCRMEMPLAPNINHVGNFNSKNLITCMRMNIFLSSRLIIRKNELNIVTINCISFVSMKKNE